MKMALVCVLTLLAFSMTGCSQTKSQSNQGSEVEAPVAIGNNRPLSKEAKPTEVELVKEWSGTIGDNYFRWDGKDLRLTPKSGTAIAIFSEFAESDYRELKKTEETKGCTTNYYYRPLAIAGNLVSFELNPAFCVVPLTRGDGAIRRLHWQEMASLFFIAITTRGQHQLPDQRVSLFLISLASMMSLPL